MAQCLRCCRGWPEDCFRSSPTVANRFEPSTASRALPQAEGHHWESRIVFDILYLVLTAGLLALSFGLVRLCDRV